MSRADNIRALEETINAHDGMVEDRVEAIRREAETDNIATLRRRLDVLWREEHEEQRAKTFRDSDGRVWFSVVRETAESPQYLEHRDECGIKRFDRLWLSEIPRLIEWLMAISARYSA